jgi:hypothetical protein
MEPIMAPSQHVERRNATGGGVEPINIRCQDHSYTRQIPVMPRLTYLEPNCSVRDLSGIDSACEGEENDGGGVQSIHDDSLEHLLHPTNPRYFKQLGPGRAVRTSRPRRCSVRRGTIRRAYSLARAEGHDSLSALDAYMVKDGSQ